MATLANTGATTGFYSTFGITGTASTGQSFTATASGQALWLTATLAQNSVGSTDTVLCDIYATDGSGLPTGSSLATSLPLDATTITASPVEYTFTFPSPTTLANGTKYAAVFSRTGALHGSLYFRHYGANPGSYAGGCVVYLTTIWSNNTSVDAKLSVGDYALPVDITGLLGIPAIVGPFKSTASRITITTTTQSTSTTFGSTTVTAYGQTWTTDASATPITQITAIIGISGSPSDTLVCTIYAVDGSNLPTGSALATSSPVTATATVCPPFVFPVPWTPSASTKYAAVFTRTGAASNTNNYLFWGAASSVYASGEPLSYNGTTWSTATNDKYLDVQGAGAYYLFGRDSTTAINIDAYKATDPTVAWSQAATQAFGNQLLTLAGYQVGSTIHLLVAEVPSLVTYRYLQYDTLTDTFPVNETIVSGLSTPGQSGASQTGCSLVVRSTGEPVAFFNGLETKTSGTFRARVYYSRRTAVNTWSAAVQVDANAAGDNIFPEAVLGPSDAVHFIWRDVSNSYRQRQLSAANALQTASSISTTSANAANGQIIPSVAYVSSGTRVVAVVDAGTTASLGTAIRFTSAAAPTLSTASVTISGGAYSAPHGLFVDGTTVYALVMNFSNNDMVVSSSTDHGATWGAFATAFTGSVSSVTGLSVDGSIYQRGSSVVIPYIVDDNGTWKYNEYFIRYANTLVSQLASNTNAVWVYGAGASSTSYTEALAQEIVVPFGKQWTISGLRVAGSRSGSPTDNLSFTLRSGSPTGTLIATSNSLVVTGWPSATTNYFVEYTFGDPVLAAGSYFLVAERSGAFDNINSPTLRIGSTSGSGPYAAGAFWVREQGTWRTSGGGSGSYGTTDLVMEIGGTEVTVPTADAWSVTDKINGTLSNADKTLTYATAASQARSTTTVPASGTGKFYAEVVVTASGGSHGNTGYGVINASASIGGLLWDSANAYPGICYTAAGAIKVDASIVTSGLPGFANGDVVCIAFDSVNKRGWVRLNGGNWNNSGTANPATNSGGFDVASLSGQVALATSMLTAGDVCTIRTEAAELTVANKPSGFTSWMGETLGPPNTNLVAAAGSYALVGAATPVTVLLKRNLPANTPSPAYALAGPAIPVGLNKGKILPAAAASPAYLLVGAATPVRLLRGLKLAAQVPSSAYALVGAATPVRLLYGRKAAANTPASPYLLVGAATPVNLFHGYKIQVTPAGNYSLVGAATPVRLLYGRKTAALTPASPYLLVGTDAALTKGTGLVNKILDATTPGAYSLVGAATPVKLLRQRKLDATTPSSYSLVAPATPVRLLYGLKVQATAPGAYSLVAAASPALLLRGRNLAASAPLSPYLLVGAASPVLLTYRRKMVATTPGAYSLIGTDITILKGAAKAMAAAAGAYNLVAPATPVALLHTYKPAAGVGAYSLTGATTTNLRKNLPLLVTPPGNYLLTGQAALERLGRVVTITPANYSLVGAATPIKLLHKYRLDATPAGAYSLVGAATPVNLLHKYRLDATPVGAYSLVGAATPIKLLHKYIVTVVASSYTLNGAAIPTNLLHKYRPAAAAGAYSLVGAATPVALLHKYKPSALAGLYTLTGTDATLAKLVLRTIAVIPGSYSLVPAATPVNLRINLPLIAGAGVYLLTGQAAFERVGKVLTANSNSYLLTGAATPANLLHKYRPVAAAGAYSLTGVAAGVAKGGAQQLVPNLYMDPDSFYPASISILQNLYPALYLDPDTFYPAYISYKQFLTPDLFLDPDSFPQSAIEAFYGDTEVAYVWFENRRMHVPAKHRMMTVSAEDRSMEVLRSDRDMDVESRRRAG